MHGWKKKVHLRISVFYKVSINFFYSQKLCVRERLVGVFLVKCREIVPYKLRNNTFEMFDFNKLKALISDIYNYFTGTTKFLKVEITKKCN